ncbi:hypothetical protein D3C87_2017060 [compost metagenome]
MSSSRAKKPLVRRNDEGSDALSVKLRRLLRCCGQKEHCFSSFIGGTDYLGSSLLNDWCTWLPIIESNRHISTPDEHSV